METSYSEFSGHAALIGAAVGLAITSIIMLIGKKPQTRQDSKAKRSL